MGLVLSLRSMDTSKTLGYNWLGLSDITQEVQTLRKRWVQCLVYALAPLVAAALLWRFLRFVHPTSYIPWLMFAVQVAYYRIDWVFWRFHHIRFFILNPDTSWDLEARYQGVSCPEDILNKAAKQLCELAVLDRAQVHCLSAERVLVVADHLHIELHLDTEDETLQVVFGKISVSFRGAQRAVSQTIVPVLERIERCFASRADTRYFLAVHFGGSNPFFGLYMRHLRPERLASMHIRVIVNGDTDVLDVRKDKVTIQTTSLSKLQSSAKTYLSLSKLPAMSA